MKRIFMVFTLLMICSFSFFPVLQTAQAKYPDQNINMIIPGTPGSIVDIVGRIMAEDLTKILGVKVVAMDKPGGSFTLGTDFVVRSKPDGYTIAYTNSSAVATAKAASPETVPYDTDKDLTPLGLHLFFPLGLAVRTDSPWKTFQDLLEYAKKNPGKLRVSTSGKYGGAFYILKSLESALGLKLTQVPYKGGSSVITALLGGHVEVCCDAAVKFTPHVKAGKFRLLTVSKDIKDFPNVKTPREMGYDVDLPSSWFAVYAPKGISEEVRQTLVAAVKKAIEEPESKAKIEKMGFVVEYGTPEELKKLAHDQYEQAVEIMKKYGSKQ